MSKTKSESKIVGHSENFRYVCEIFAMCNSEIFFFLKKNKINNNNNKKKNNIFFKRQQLLFLNKNNKIK